MPTHPSDDPEAAVLCEMHGAVATITLNAPDKRNALSNAVRDGLVQQLRSTVQAPDVRAIVVAARGKVFCSGGDISGMVSGDLLHYRQRMRSYHEIVRLLVDGPKPVIAAVQGAAYGAGFSLAMACDHVVAVPHARFCSAFATLNLIPDMGLMHTLSRRVGAWHARRILMTAEVLHAEDACARGVVDELCAPEGLMEAARAAAHRYAQLAPGAFALVKSAFACGATGALEDILRLETEGQAALRGSPDHHEAVAAFLEKRAPRFLPTP